MFSLLRWMSSAMCTGALVFAGLDQRPMVTRHAIELLGGSEASLMKECANPECTRIFLDRSRGRRREWCSMDPCGNKIKAAAYRARKKKAQAADASPIRLGEESLLR
jgi:hypothetical protein